MAQRSQLCYVVARTKITAARSFPESLIGEQAEYLPNVKLQYVPKGTLSTDGMAYNKIFAFVEQRTIVDVRCD